LYEPNGSRRYKKRWQEHTEELYKKDFHDPDNHDGVITHLEPDILECEVKRALGSITILQYHSSKASILQCSAFFIVQLSHPYITTGKTIALTR